MGGTKAMWTVLLVLSTWPYEATAQNRYGYVGARGQITSHNSGPIRWSGFYLSHRMVLEGGSYRLGSPGRLWGITIGGTIYSEYNSYYEEPEGIDGFGDDSPFARMNIDDEFFYYNTYKDWRIPFHAELQYMRFPGGQIGAGRYYRAGIRATNTLRKSRGEWEWSWRIGYLSYHLGVGYGWKVGAGKNVRLEGNFILCQSNPCLQAAMTFGRWW